MNDQPSAVHDLIIIGAGPAGLALARALGADPLSVAIVDPTPREALADAPFDGREIALSADSVAQLRDYGIWPHIADQDISRLRDARVRDGGTRSALHLQADGAGELGRLVPNHRLRQASYASLADAERLGWYTARVTGLQTASGHAELSLDDGRRLRARLVVAADSRFSETRRAMGIAARMRDFGKSMLVCRLEHELPHRQTAEEWFVYGATIALLPLNGSRSSLVLTQPHRQIAALAEAAPEDFAARIGDWTGHHLGRLSLASSRHVYPLVAVWAEQFCKERYALIGDAAVGMHPVTAHGYNLGLRSVATLASAVRAAQRRGADIGALPLLRGYEAEHRRAARPLYELTNALVGLYTDERLPARLARRAALQLTEHLPPLKRLIVAPLRRHGDRRPGVAPG